MAYRKMAFRPGAPSLLVRQRTPFKIFPATDSPTAAQFANWYTVPGSESPIGPPFDRFFIRCEGKDVLTMFGRMADWVLEYQVVALWPTSVLDVSGNVVVSQETYDSMNQVTPKFGPRSTMPSITEHLLPHGRYPSLHIPPQNIGAFHEADSNADGYVLLTIDLDFEQFGPSADLPAMFPNNPGFDGLSLFNDGPVIPQTFYWDGYYYLSPTASVRIDGYLQFPDGDQLFFTSTLSTPTPNTILGTDPSTGAVTEVSGFYTVPVGQGQCVRKYFPDAFNDGSDIQIAVSVPTLLVRAPQAAGFFAFGGRYSTNTGK